MITMGNEILINRLSSLSKYTKSTIEKKWDKAVKKDKKNCQKNFKKVVNEHHNPIIFILIIW